MNEISGVSAESTPTPPPPLQMRAIRLFNPVVTLTAMVISACLIFCVCGIMVYLRLRRRISARARNRNLEDPQELIGLQRRRINDALIKSFPTFNFSTLDLKPDSGEATCCVCLGDYTEADIVRKLPPCGHFFHTECIDSWLQQNATCPVCRTPVLKSMDAELNLDMSTASASLSSVTDDQGQEVEASVPLNPHSNTAVDLPASTTGFSQSNLQSTDVTVGVPLVCITNGSQLRSGHT